MKILLISTTDFISKSGNCAQQKEPSRTPQNMCLKFADRTTIKHQPYLLENCAELMQPYLDFCAAIKCWPYLDFCAALMKSVLYRPYHDFLSIKCRLYGALNADRTLPRFLCNSTSNK